MKRRISLLVLIAMLLCALPSCSGDAEETTPADTTAIESETTAVETENPYDPHLPAADYDGYTMTFAVRGKESDHTNWDGTDIVVEELTGDSLNDAIYERNTYMGDTYNVQIASIFCGDTSVATTGSDMFKRVEKSILGGMRSLPRSSPPPMTPLAMRSVDTYWILAGFPISISQSRGGIRTSGRL